MMWKIPGLPNPPSSPPSYDKWVLKQSMQIAKARYFDLDAAGESIRAEDLFDAILVIEKELEIDPCLRHRD